jgi:hypothetical protein
MRIRTRPASANISLEARAPNSDRPVPTVEIVSFELLPIDGHDHLDLDTGEVFQDYGFAKLRKNEEKLISASITIHAIPDDSYYQYNAMYYMDEMDRDDFSRPSSIFFDLFMAPAAFRELADNIRSGLLPESITVNLVHDPSLFFTTTINVEKKPILEYGWEPDGSGMIWHNKERESQKIQVESVKFDYAAAKRRYDEKMRLLPIHAVAPTEHMNRQLALIENILVDALKYLRWTAIGIVALVIIIGFLIAKQRMPF